MADEEEVSDKPSEHSESEKGTPPEVASEIAIPTETEEAPAPVAETVVVPIKIVEEPIVDEFIEQESVGEEVVEEEEVFVSIFDILDAPRYLPEPVELTFDHLKQVANELGLITLCWPDIKQPDIVEKFHYPESYYKNTNKEKLLLLYAENFRQQFHYKYANRKPLFLAADNICGQQKMVCTTLRPTTLTHTEIEQWQDCASFVGDHLIYEPLETPTLIPNRLYAPHTVFMRKSGNSYEIATALCSILIGLNYKAYVVSGYAVRDVTLKIMTRVNSPYPEGGVKEKEKPPAVVDPKYVLKPPKDLRSQFLLAMKQREVDKAIAEKQRIIDEAKKLRELQEQPPYDELHGLRVHSWVLIMSGKRDIEEDFFIEASTGYKYPLDAQIYCGIESLWNHENYWVNLQDCSDGISKMDYDLTNLSNWEHLLLGEPIYMRVSKEEAEMDEEEMLLQTIFQEKHLDIPAPWSLPINIPHDVIKKRFPTGIRQTGYKRTLVEEFAPYIQEDGLVVRICRYDDMDYSPDQMYMIEECYENRHDHMTKVTNHVETGFITEYFSRGREDAVKLNSYYLDNNIVEADRTIEFYYECRFDCMAKLELHAEWMREHYIGREDKFYFRDVRFAKRGQPPPGILEGPRRIVVNLEQKFNRNFNKKAWEDIAYREFAIVNKEIHLKFHYDKGKATASSRDFIKPAMGDRLTFDMELTSGYQSEVGAKPLRQLNLFSLLESQIKEEAESLRQVREVEDQVSDFVRLRDMERAVPKLDISIFNREQNVEYLTGMKEREQLQIVTREREVEEETDFFAPYLAKLSFPFALTEAQAMQARDQCLADFKNLLLKRANDIQHQFDKCTQDLQDNQVWYESVLDSLTLQEEETYFKGVNDANYHLHTLEMRLTRHRELCPHRFRAVEQFLNGHPALAVLHNT